MSARQRRRWVLARVARSAARRGREGWAASRRAERIRWVRIVALGYAGLILLALALIWLARRLIAAGALTWEGRALRWLEVAGPFDFSSALWFQTFGSDITLTLVVLASAGIAAWIRRPLRALGILGAFVLMDPVIRIAWLVWDRARPTLIMDGQAAPGFASFPSGHTAKTIAVYGFLCYLWGRASRRPVERALAVLLGVAIPGVVALGRLRMGVHWPSDVVAGALLGAIWLAVLVSALRRAEPPARRPAPSPAPAASPGSPLPGSTASA